MSCLVCIRCAVQ